MLCYSFGIKATPAYKAVQYKDYILSCTFAIAFVSFIYLYVSGLFPGTDTTTGDEDGFQVKLRLIVMTNLIQLINSQCSGQRKLLR